VRLLGLSGRALVLAGLVLVPLAATLVLLTVAGRDLRDATDDRVQANQRTVLVTQIGLRVVDIETALRGYALTGDARFVTARDNAVAVIPMLERRLRLLLPDRAAPPARKVARFLSGVDAYISTYADPLLRDLRFRVRSAHSTRRTLIGKARVDAIRRQFTTLVQDQQAKSETGTDRANASADRSNLIGIIGIISLPLLVILAALIVSRELRRSRDDVTLANAETQDAAETNRAMLEASNDGFLAMDEDGVVLAFTPQAGRIFGHPVDDVIGHVLADVVLLPQERAAHHERRRRLLADGTRSAPYRVGVRRADGRSRIVEITAAPATTSSRRMGVYFVRDVTEDHLREEERLAEEAVGRVLVQSDRSDDLVPPILAAIGASLNALHGSFWRYDEQERSISCTDTWTAPGTDASELERRLLSLRHTPGEPPDTSPVAIAWATGREQWMAFPDTLVGRALPAGDAQAMRGVFVVPVTFGGEMLAALAFVTGNPEPPGEIRWAALRSITDLIGQVLGRRQAEQEAERLTHDFFALMSHELRTPLTSLMGYLDMVRDEEIGDLNEDQEQYLDVVDRSARRLMRLVGDLLFVAQIESGRLPLDLAPTDLEQVVRDAVESARIPAQAAGVTVTAEATTVTIAAGDADRLAQLVDNLVSNAIKFTPPGGTITVRLRREGDLAVLEVQDTGIGISAEDEERLFERFYRSEHAHREAVAGLGLGLSICLAIVEAHGGTLSVTNAPEGGTIARATFPGATA